MNAQSAFVHQYRRVNTYSGLESREPHTLVSMLYDGVAEALSNARGALERGDMAAKGTAVVRGVDILESLRTSLDLERGGEVARNLERLYHYMLERLTQANLRNELAVLDEISTLNQTLREAWAAIPDAARRQTS